MTQDEMGKIFEVSRQTISAWRKEGMPGDLAGAVGWVRRNKPMEDASLTDGKRRKVQAEARLKELELLIAEGKLIDKQQPLEWVGAEITTARNSFLAMAKKLPPSLYGKTQSEIFEILNQEIREILTRMGTTK